MIYALQIDKVYFIVAFKYSNLEINKDIVYLCSLEIN